jgi:hypothetical protein
MDLTVVGGRGEEDAVFGVCPGDAPDGPFVAVEEIQYINWKFGVSPGLFTLVESVVTCAGLRQSRRSLLFCRMSMSRGGGRSSRGQHHAGQMVSTV